MRLKDLLRVTQVYYRPVNDNPGFGKYGALRSNVRWDVSAVLLLVVAALVMGRLLFMPLGNSFWLDETVIAFLIRNNFQETIHRAFIIMHPVLFTAIAW